LLSSFTASSHLFLGFPTGSFPNIWPTTAILGILRLSSLCTSPAHCNLSFVKVYSSSSP
jgi:hypothetical protein